MFEEKLVRTGNYCAFYVAEPFNAGPLAAHATKDFVYYNTLRMWKGAEPTFPFSDSHATTYNVRDGSDWETTLKPRLRERLRRSKNVLLFLSTETVNSRAIREEVEYGIEDQKLPFIIVYPDYKTRTEILSNGSLKQSARDLWSKIPALRDHMHLVPTLHVPLHKETIAMALRNTEFMFDTKIGPAVHIYPVT
jgi:hypothetical protein